MKKLFGFIVLFLAVIFVVTIVTDIQAVPSGKKLEYTNIKIGNVIFDGKKHADAGKKCNDCHPKVFAMKKGTAKMTMKEMGEGKFCGACHNGSDSFELKSFDSCNKCHQKAQTEKKEDKKKDKTPPKKK